MLAWSKFGFSRGPWLFASSTDDLEPHLSILVRIKSRRVEVESAALEVFVEGWNGTGRTELPEHFDVLEFLTEVTDDAEGCVEQFEE